MNHSDIAIALHSLAPGAEWNLSGDDLSGLIWVDQTIARPADVDILATIARGPPPQVPNEISDRQFFQQLAVAGIITQSDALAAVKTGTMPTALQALVNSLPVEQQFPAEMMLSGSVVFHRNHPMVAELGVAYGWTSAQLDALWTAAASL